MARRFARSYPECEAEDIESELAVCLTRDVDQMLASFGRTNDPGAPPHGYVRRCLERKATTYCRRERARRIRHSDQYQYRREDVMEAFQHFGRTGHWENVPLPEDYGHHVSKLTWEVDEDPSDRHALYMDVMDAWPRIVSTQQAAIRQHARHDTETDPPLSGQVRSAAMRAYDALAAAMNANSPRAYDQGFPGTRQAMSNQQAQAITDG